jgi:hypothetical protein
MVSSLDPYIRAEANKQRGKVLRVILALLDEDNSQQFSSELWDWWNMVSFHKV